MKAIIYSTILITLIANPAPQTIGIFEIIIALFMVATLAFCLRTHIKMTGTNSIIFFIWGFYAVSLCISAGYGLIQGANSFKVLGSIVPFFVFVPIIIYVMARPKIVIDNVVENALIFVGMCQAVFLLYLYFGRTIDLQDLETVLQYRTTYLNPRTTLPFLLASATIPLARIQLNNHKSILWIIIVGLSFVGALTTQTRSLILAVVFGVVVYVCIGFLFFMIKNVKFTRTTLVRLLFTFLILLAVIVGIAFKSNAIQALSSAVVYRSMTSGDNGRIEDEWKPAIKQWSSGNVANYVIGMGLGIPFENRVLGQQNFMHNIGLYNLIYGGFLGLIVILTMYVVLLLVFFDSGPGDPRVWACVACVLAMFLYAQFFAVFKSLGYNCMLCYLWAIAVNKRYRK
jgi:hypothetical protein